MSGKDNELFTQGTDLDWSIVGCVNSCVDYVDAIESSHRITVRQVTPSLQSPANLISEVQYICQTQAKELITSADVIKVLESDVNERTVEDAHFSQEDLRFISIMEEGIKINADGHYEMPLPFKESTSPSQWRHVTSEENPTDHASRGLKAKKLIASCWFTGPDFLWRDKLLSGRHCSRGPRSSSTYTRP